MNKSVSFLVLMLLFILAAQLVTGQRNYPPKIECDKEVVYKTVDDIQLKLWIFNPPQHKISDKKAAAVFFFGGGWRQGSPEQFVKHCEYLSARGMVAMVADYRVLSRHNTKAVKCVSDAKSAIRWIRENAEEIGVDPNRILAGGGSAGGHLAAAAGTLPMHDEPNENKNISSVPNALALFNPAVILAPIDENIPGFNDRFKDRMDRLGAVPESMSPYHNVKKGLPPTIIFHGTGDETVLFKTVELFTQKMKRVGNQCKLVAYEGESHGFFNYGKNDNGTFFDNMNKLDRFLVSLGYIKAPPKSYEE